MSEFAKFLVEKLMARKAAWDNAGWHDGIAPFPIEAENGTDYGGMTGCSGAHLNIDWDALQSEIAAFEAEFRKDGK